MSREPDGLDGWMQLAAPFFQATCRRVMDGYMAERGFRFRPSDNDYVVYRSGRSFVRFHYWLEDCPNYSPMIAIGLAPRFWERLHFSDVALWYAIPEGEAARSYPEWRFSSADELAAALSRMKDEVLDRFAFPLLREPRRLAALIRRREQEWRQEMKSHSQQREGRGS